MLPAPPSWGQLLPYRCAAVCQHGRNGQGQPCGPRDTPEACAHPEVTGRRSGGLVPLTHARARGGPCGPEAEHLSFGR